MPRSRLKGGAEHVTPVQYVDRMGITNQKGDLAELIVGADLQRQGHGVALPVGHDWPFDLLVLRADTGAIERVQVKYTVARSGGLDVRCRSNSAWVNYRYTAEDVDWIAVYERTTDACYYVPSSVWDGRVQVKLRLEPTRNNQGRGIRWAKDYRRLPNEPEAPPSTIWPDPPE